MLQRGWGAAVHLAQQSLSGRDRELSRPSKRRGGDCGPYLPQDPASWQNSRSSLHEMSRCSNNGLHSPVRAYSRNFSEVTPRGGNQRISIRHSRLSTISHEMEGDSGWIQK